MPKRRSSPISTKLVALLIFLQLNVHHWLLRGLAKSFQYCPPGMVVATPVVAEQIWRAAGGMLIIAVQIAIPTLLATMLIDIALGFLGRASPQLPVLVRGDLRQERRGVSGGDGDIAVLAGVAREVFRGSAGDERATDAFGAIGSRTRGGRKSH